MRIAEARNRFAPVLVIAVRTAFLAGDFLSILHQARAEGAVHDFNVDQRQKGICN